MEHKRTSSFLFFLLLLSLFTLMFISPTIVNASEFDNMSYDPIFWEDWAASKTGALTDTLIVNVTEDTITSEQLPSANYGANEWLSPEETGAGGGRARHMWYKFDLSAYGSYDVKNISIYWYYKVFADSEDIDIYASHNLTWLEHQITWNDEPSYDSVDLLYDDFMMSGPEGSWEEIYSSEIFNHTKSYLGSNATIMFHDTEAGDGSYNWLYSKEFNSTGVIGTKCPYLLITYNIVGGGGPLTPITEWYSNSTLGITANNPLTTYNNASISREIGTDSSISKLEINAMLRTNSSTGLQNATFLSATYLDNNITKYYAVYFSENEVGLVYWNWSNQYTIHNYSYSIIKTEYYTIETLFESATRLLTFEISNRTNSIYEATVPVGISPASIRNVSLILNARSSITAANLVWVEAPFKTVDAVRPWHTETENPYHIVFESEDKENYLKVMPLQGFKAQWNCSYDSGVLYEGALDAYLNITFCDEFGNATGEIYFMFDWFMGPTPPYLRAYIALGGGPALDVWMWDFTTTGSIHQADMLSFAFWIEDSGSAFVYVQTNPHSSDYGDYWIYDVTSEVNFNTWGAIITHGVDETEATTNTIESVMREVEIFAGIKQGISQPRFGGMWWLYNPILVLANLIARWFFAVAAWIGAILAPVISAVGTYLSPFIQTVASNINGLITWLSNQLDALLDIWGVIGSIVVDLVLEFIDEFIIPMAEGIFNWIILNFIARIWGAVIFVVGVLDLGLSVLSNWLWGDATILSGLLTSAGLFIFETIRGIGYFIVSGRIATIATYVYGLLHGINTPIGWATTTVSTIPDMIMLGMYWVVSYAPAFFMIYMTIALLRIMANFIEGDFDFEAFRPLWEIFWLFWKIANFAIALIRSMINAVWSVIVAIMEIIPF